MRKHERDIAKLAIQFGRKVIKTKGGHIALTAEGKETVIVSNTPSDRRTMKNLAAQLRRSDR